MYQRSPETVQKKLIYSNKKVILKDGTIDRRENNPTDINDRCDSNLDNRITKFHTLIETNYVYRIHLRYLVGQGPVNFPIKFDTKFSFNLETNYTKLFESRKKVTTIPTPHPDVKIIYMP